MVTSTTPHQLACVKPFVRHCRLDSLLQQQKQESLLDQPNPYHQPLRTTTISTANPSYQPSNNLSLKQPSPPATKMNLPKAVSEESPWRCAKCRITRTPVRRNGPDGKKTLCNACGLRHSKQKRADQAAKSLAARNLPSSFVKLEPAASSIPQHHQQPQQPQQPQEQVLLTNKRDTQSCSDLPTMLSSPTRHASSSPTSSEPKSAPPIPSISKKKETKVKRTGQRRKLLSNQVRGGTQSTPTTPPVIASEQLSSSANHQRRQEQIPFSSLSRQMTVDDEDMAPLLNTFQQQPSTSHPLTTDQQVSLLMPHSNPILDTGNTDGETGGENADQKNVVATDDFFENPATRIFGDDENVNSSAGFLSERGVGGVSGGDEGLLRGDIMDVGSSRRVVRANAQNMSRIDEWMARNQISSLESKINVLEHERQFMQKVLEQSKAELRKKDDEIQKLRLQVERTFRAWTDALFPVSSTTTSVEQNERNQRRHF